jgi:hypothetical protein
VNIFEHWIVISKVSYIKIVEPYVLLELMETGGLKKTFNPQRFKKLLD